MPDALSKTVPIWTAVMNRTLFPNEDSHHGVQFPPDFLGASEESQIEERIDGFVAALKVCLLFYWNAMNVPCICRLIEVLGLKTGLGRTESSNGKTSTLVLGYEGVLLAGISAGQRFSSNSSLLSVQARSWNGDV